MKYKPPKLLFVVALAALICAATSQLRFTSDQAARELQEAQIEQAQKANGTFIAVSKDYGHDPRPDYRFLLVILTSLIFLSLVLYRKLWLPTLLNSVSFLIVLYWITQTIKGLELNPSYMGDSPYLLKIATPYDYAVFGMVSILFVWLMILVILDFHGKRTNSGKAN